MTRFLAEQAEDLGRDTMVAISTVAVMFYRRQRPHRGGGHLEGSQRLTCCTSFPRLSIEGPKCDRAAMAKIRRELPRDDPQARSQ